MTSREFLISGLVLITLVLGIVITNFYFIRPILAIKIPKLVLSAPGEVNTSTVDQNIVATTLHKIRTMFPAQQSAQNFKPRKVKRNPFLWPEESIAVAQGKVLPFDNQKSVAGKIVPQLKMTIIGEKRKIALINEQFVFEGSKFHGDTVQSITADEVILRGDKGETHLSLMQNIAPPPMQETMITEATPGSQSQEEIIEALFEKLTPFLKQKKKNEPERTIKEKEQK